MPSYSDKSKARLATCEWALQQVMNEVIKYRDCSILCGTRNKIDQDLAFSKGFSTKQFPDSRHNVFPSEAVDVMAYPINWTDKNAQHEFAGYVLAVADSMGIKLKWGGHFDGLYDAAHFELERQWSSC